MGYHIAEKGIQVSEEILERESLLSTADKNLARLLRHNPINPTFIHSRHTRLSFIETQLGIATLVLARNHITSQQIIIDNFQAAKEYLEFAVKVAVSPASSDDIQHRDDGCEILYGRAGLLYALLYLRKVLRSDISGTYFAVGQGTLQSLVSDTNLSCLIESIISRGKHGSPLTSSPTKLPPYRRWCGNGMANVTWAGLTE